MQGKKVKCEKINKIHRSEVLPNRQCKWCNIVRVRERAQTKEGKIYAKIRSERQRNTNQKRAYRFVANAIRYNGWPKPNKFNCLCSRLAEVYDHRDYLKPWEVNPVCRKCNWKLGPAKNRSKK